MNHLLKLDAKSRKEFAFQQLQDIPEWKDVTSMDEFEMEQNKGMGSINN